MAPRLCGVAVHCIAGNGAGRREKPRDTIHTHARPRGNGISPTDMSRQDASTDVYLRTRHRHAPYRHVLYRRILYRHVLYKHVLYRRVSTGVPLQACLYRHALTGVYVHTHIHRVWGGDSGEGGKAKTKLCLVRHQIANCAWR